ncbi:caspase family protein [Spirulina sp. 06S082]|uniref:caspase family protein n=1 Tax=Spirulina sp. 06S082 TaxID=3110248 RepID=UPI002B1FEA0D|nr:caspase family protein [Spirulina sp. 06S082]MEA5470441.1 caspase family protein [Spirulina sp. 06S082]
MGLDRRTFLQGAGLAFLATGMGAGGGDRLTPLGIASHFQALAQSKGRKLALLVGINRYGTQNILQGCGTDVELQQELLIHRFGFNPQDILVLTDAKATRENIEAAFAEFLLPQAKAGDSVLFHFSGCGGKVKLSPSEANLANCLLTAGGKLGEEGILEEILILWGHSLATTNLTMVLDTSYVGKADNPQGNSRSRSTSQAVVKFTPQTALTLLETGREKEKTLDRLLGQNLKIPGILLQAAREGENAIEVAWDGFSAGLFTYALVQALWQATSPATMQTVFNRSASQMQGIGTQRPQKLGSQSQEATALAYFSQPESPLGSEGFITTVDSQNNAVSLHLPGLPIVALQNNGVNSQFVTPEPGAIALKVISRSGLTVKAERVNKLENPENSLFPGQLVEESLRVLSRKIGLIVALDTKLSRIERVDATSAFGNISTVSAVVTAGEKAADCLFSRANSPLSPTLDAKQSLPQGYGLFSSGYVSLPNTLGKSDEAIKAAVERLAPKFNILLAVKLWQAIVNEASSQLAVKASLQVLNPQLSRRIEGRTRGFVVQKPANNRFEEGLLTVPLGESIEFEIENGGDRPLYFALLGVQTNGNPLVFYSSPSLDTKELKLQDIIIEPGSVLQLPKLASTLNGFTVTAPGIGEMIVICSRSPFDNLGKFLATLTTPNDKNNRLIGATQPMELTRALLQDLHNASGFAPSDDNYKLDVKTWAALRFVYRVV